MRYLIAFLVVLAAWTSTPAAEFLDGSVEFDFTREQATITAVSGVDSGSVGFQFAEIRSSGTQILIRDRVLISLDTLFVGDLTIILSGLTPSDAIANSGGYRITLTPADVRSHSRRRVERDRFAAFEQLRVPTKDFVRGNVLCVGEEATIEGEVNGNVVALFGDVRLASTAICQRDVFAIGGSVDKHRQARVYGVYQSSNSWRRIGSRNFRGSNATKAAVTLDLDLSYNRVDGFSLLPGLTFRSQEKFVPKFFFSYGYGFTSQLAKYRLGFEQTLFDYNQMKFGGSVYRLTQTEDGWIADEEENDLYALLIREDFRDYYQGEGGNIYAEQHIGYTHTFRLDYTYEALTWMPAHNGLWSLFGGDKKFRDNFSSVAPAVRDPQVAAFDDENEAVLKASYVLNTVENERGEMARSGWVAGVQYEHSSDRIGSDFGYDRYQFELRRYQPLTYLQNFNVRLLYGGANGTLPLHRYFYLGGIRTLRAYDIKQFYGSHLALADCEYVVDFTHSEIGLSLLFDVGKTGWDSDFLSKGKWYGDVGIGARLGDWLRVELSRQINGDTDKLQLSALIGRSF